MLVETFATPAGGDEERREERLRKMPGVARTLRFKLITAEMIRCVRVCGCVRSVGSVFQPDHLTIDRWLH